MGQMIELTSSDGFILAAYRAEPAGKPRGGLVVVQEIFGVNNHIKRVADGYAENGYLVLAPSFFDRVQTGVDLGYTQADIEAGRAITQALSWENTVRDARAAVDLVKSAGKAAVVGYCWGGTLARLSATRISGLACAICYYGGGIPNMYNETPQCPVMFHWGEKDHAIPMEAVRKIEAAHPSAISHTYAAGHGFNCDERASFEAASARQARERSLEFLRQHVS
jgi:carboxymethylenebutenolidase